MTLHKTTELIKKFIKISIVVGGTFFILLMIFRIGVFVKGIMFPPKPIPPDVKYGKLPPIPFGQPALKEKFTYSIDTLTGKLPVLPTKITVYKVVHKETTLLNSDQADAKATAIQFTDEKGEPIPHKALQAEQYQWIDTASELPRTLTMDINSFNFTLEAPYINYEPILKNTYIANNDGAKAVVEQMLKNMGLLYEDLDPQKVKTEQLSIKDGALIPAKTLSATQIVKVDLFQKDLLKDPDIKLPIYYPRYPYSTMEFLVTSRSLDFTDIVQGNFVHQEVKFPDKTNPDPEDSATYPMKTAEEAFQELEDGKGFVSNYYGTSKDIPITDVTLGYFLSDQKQDYLMPVIAFHASDGEFYGFVSAISNEWIDEEK